MFQVDRAMQLLVHFRTERLVHHMLTSTWTLLVMEWSRYLRDPGVFVTGAIMEGLAKFSWYFHFIARMNRAFIRNQSNTSEWNKVSIVGADVLFLSKTARKQTRFMQLGYGIFLFAHLVAPFVLVGVYLGMMKETVSMVWKISLPCIFVIFNLLDAGQYKSFSKQSKYSYWTNTVLLETGTSKQDETERQSPNEKVQDRTSSGTSTLTTKTASTGSLVSTNV